MYFNNIFQIFCFLICLLLHLQYVGAQSGPNNTTPEYNNTSEPKTDSDSVSTTPEPKSQNNTTQSEPVTQPETEPTSSPGTLSSSSSPEDTTSTTTVSTIASTTTTTTASTTAPTTDSTTNPTTTTTTTTDSSTTSTTPEPSPGPSPEPSTTTMRKTTTSESVPVTQPVSQQTSFGSYGLVAFAITFGIAVVEFIIIIVMVCWKRCERTHVYDTEKAEQKATKSGDMHLQLIDAGFSGVQTVDLDSDQDLAGDGKIGNGGGGMTTFGESVEPRQSAESNGGGGLATSGESVEPRQPTASNEEDQQSSGDEQPSWLKVEPSAGPIMTDHTIDLIEPNPDPGQDAPPKNVTNDNNVFNERGGTTNGMDDEPLLPPPPPELDVSRNGSSSLSENSVPESNNPITEM